MTTEASSFDPIAARVQTRVLLRRWLRLLALTLWPAVTAFGIIALLRGFTEVGAWLPAFALIAWIGSTTFWAFRRKPSKYEALALWDQTQNRSEAFAAAWWFEQLPQKTALQQRHLEAQTAHLSTATQQLAKDLPLPLHRWLWVAPALALVGIAVSALRPLPAGDLALDEAMKQAAVHEAQQLAQNDWQKKKLEGLTAEETKALDKLKQDVKGSAEDLEKGGAGSARELLSDLEKRARDAEKLAQRLGDDKDSWASDAMIAELRKHADTADLGDAAANKNAAQTAKAAQDLATHLKQPQLPIEARDRLNETLKEVQKVAVPDDRQRSVGTHVLAAGDELAKTNVPAAAAEFEKLADKMRDQAQREQTRKELEKLAQQLRDAGSRIAGQQGGGMQPMQGASEQAQAQQAAQMQGQNSQAQQALQPPGLNQQGQSQQMLMQQPQQGNGTGQQQQMSVAQGQPQNGQQGQQGQGNQNRPMLLAPIPGAKADQQPSAIIMAPNLPQDTNNAATMAGPGGPSPGAGKAKLDAAKTAQTKADGSSVVTAKSGSEGASSTRSIDGGIKQESATRTAQETSVDFINEQEAALDDAALPPQRREQVRRYFGELRKRFEQK